MSDQLQPGGALVLVDPQPLDENPALVYLARLGNARARVVQAQALALVAELLTGQPDIRYCQWGRLRFQHTQAIRAKLPDLVSSTTGRPLAPATVNRILCALRGCLRAAWRLGQMGSDDYQRAADLPSLRGSVLLSGRRLSPEEIRALIAACESDPSPAGVRDTAIIAVLYSCGLRRAELVALQLESYDIPAALLRVFGKGSKEREVPIGAITGRALVDWLGIRGYDPGALFCSITKGGQLQPGYMTGQAVYYLLARRGKQAGVAKFSPHDLRRTCASDLLEAKGDLSAVARFLGHEDPRTTKHYDRRGFEAVRALADLLSVPYKGRGES